MLSAPARDRRTGVWQFVGQFRTPARCLANLHYWRACVRVPICVGLCAAALSEAELGLQRSQRYPDISASIGSQYDEIERERVNLVGLSVPLPLFDQTKAMFLAAARRAERA